MPKKKDIMQFQRVRRYKAGVAAINAADDATGIGTALAAHGKKLDLDMVAYGRLSETGQGVVCAAVLSNKPDTVGYASRDTVAAVFDAVLLERKAAEFALNLVNEALSAERLAWVLEQHGEALGLDLAGYSLLTGDNREAVCEEILEGQPYADEDAVQSAFEDAVEEELEKQALAAINAATAEKMGEVIIMYADVFGLDLEDYDALDGDGKDSVHAAMVDKDFQTGSAVKDAFDSAVEDAQGAGGS